MILILDPDAYMHVSMMHIYMTLDPDACMYDAVMNDAYVSKILYPDTCIPDAGFFPDGRTDQRTNGQADSRSWIVYEATKKKKGDY